MKSWPVTLVCVALMSLTVVLATQWTASRLGHQHGLGPRLEFNDWRFYPPWSILTWSFAETSAASQTLRHGRLVVLAGTVATALVVTRFGYHTPKVRPVGASKWATLAEVRKAGLLPKPSTAPAVIVGQFGGSGLTGIDWFRRRCKVLRYDGPEHQLVTGATRSGKGVGHVVPTLLSWSHSALVYDTKSELWEITAGFRSRFSHVFFFNPTRDDSVRYNPLLEVRRGAKEVADTQNIVEMLVNSTGEKQTFDVWDQHASQTLVALILHVLYVEEDKSLGRVRDLLLDFDDTFPVMMQTTHRIDPQTGQPQTHPEVARVAKDMLAQPPKFQAGVRATAAGYLILFADEVVRRNTSASDFRVADLMCAENPVTLYLQPPPSDGPRLRPLMRILLNQACRALLEHLDTDATGRPKRHRLLLELDEFATLGRLEFLQTNLRQMSGYGIKAHLIVQSFSDIVESYGRDNTILDNCHVVVSFACADTVTQQRVSQMAGTVTEYRRGYSRPRPRSLLAWLSRGDSHGSTSDAEQVRPLMQPGEVRELPQDQQLVFVTGHPPIRCRKVRYYRDPRFCGRLMPPPDQGCKLDVPANPSRSSWLTSEKPTVPLGPELGGPAAAKLNPPSEDSQLDTPSPLQATDATEPNLFTQSPEQAEVIPGPPTPHHPRVGGGEAPLFTQSDEDPYAL